MAGPKQIFRQKAYERLSSPESLDQIMRVSGALDWLGLIALGLVIVVIVSWSVFGSLPTTVAARGVLVHPSQVVDCQVLGAGRLETLNVKTGDVVRKGDVLGRIDQTDVRKRLQEDRQLLADLQSQDRAKTDLQDRQVQLHGKQDDSQRKFLQMQRDNQNNSLQDAKKLTPILKKRLDSLTAMKNEGFLAEISPDLLSAQQAVLQNDAAIADLTAKLQQSDGQIRQLDTDVSTLDRDVLESTTARKNQIRDVRSRIAVSELELERNSNIVSEYSGKILEVVVAPGEVLTNGARIARLDLDDGEQTLVTIAYFPVGDGKKIRPGMAVQITPDTVERQRYGGILGTVSAVSSEPVTREGTIAVLGNPEVVQGLMSGGPYIAVTAQMQRSSSTSSGYAWSSSKGPASTMSSGLTATVRTTIEQRAPITYALPFLRSLSGTD